MGKISIVINEYKVEGIEFQFLENDPHNHGRPVAMINFTIGLYDEGGNKITSVTFSNDKMGLPFKPNQNINDLLRRLLIELDSWVEKNYLPVE